MRLIDADALEKEGIPFETHGGATFIALGSVRSAPTINPESLRPKGEWIYNKKGKLCCSNCGFEPTYSHNTRNGFSNANYCPNCGNYMRG